MKKYKNLIIALVIIAVALCAVLVFSPKKQDVPTRSVITVEDEEVKTDELPLESITVASSVCSVGKLTTAEYHFEHLEPYSDTKKIEDSIFSFLNGKEIPFTKSSFWYKCEGCISVGINFDQIVIDVDNMTNTITVELPAVEIFSCVIDSDKDEFYDEHNSVFNKLDGYDYSKAHSEVIKDEKAKVKENGTMDSALANAKLIITNMIYALPHGNEYEIVYQMKN